MVEQWNSESGTVCWNSGTVMVKRCGARVERCWWNSGTVLVEKWNSVWWNSGRVKVEQCRWNSNGRIVRRKSGTMLAEQCGGTVEQCW